MNYFPQVLIFTLLCLPNFIQAQINYTANDGVTPYNEVFRFGANPGYHGNNWDNDDLANIAAGNENLASPGVGVKTFRPSLADKVLGVFGYDIELEAFQHYYNIDVKENVTFVGYPKEENKDVTNYCADYPSQLFKNMYLPIWDDGANGTPINDENNYALYLYNIVNLYKDQVRFWEVWNEPDFDYSGNGWKPIGTAGNWWENTPEPCDYKLWAPVQHYVRLLRISYEVIKYLAPDDYVAVGGLGYASFLDVILRHTDNPIDGSVTDEYPLYGGAYFDVLSFHSYPHIDGSLRYWSNDVGGFVYTRHSDKAVEGVINLKNVFDGVLTNYGYDGETYPEKVWIITESNIPRKTFGENIGSELAQRNFLPKIQLACEQNDIKQYHIYTLADEAAYDEATSEFQLMGLYEQISNIMPGNETRTAAGLACETHTELLFGKPYDAQRTAAMNLPDAVGGGAYKWPDSEKYTYLLWAKTETDQSETATANYAFPSAFAYTEMKKRHWDFGQTAAEETISAENILLNGSPVYLTDASISPTNDLNDAAFVLEAKPNPFTENFQINFEIPLSANVQLRLLNSQGAFIRHAIPNIIYAAGVHQIQIEARDLSVGVYTCLMIVDGERKSIRLVKF